MHNISDPIELAQETIKDITSKEEIIFLNHPSSSSISSEPNFEVSIGSYNVLADDYISPEMEQAIKKEYVNFPYRSHLILEDLHRMNADVFLLQEVDHMERFYQEQFEKLGYGVISKQRPNSLDHVAILYKKALFEPVSQNFIDFDTGHKYTHKNAFRRSNVAVFSKLRHLATNEMLSVLGTHLHWNPRIEYVRYLQTTMIMKFLNENCEESEHVIWGGDLNSRPEDNNVVYVQDRSEPEKERIQYFDKKILELQKEMHQEMKNYPDHFEWGNLYQSYGKANSTGDGFPPYTNYTFDFKNTIDYLFYSKKTITPLKMMKIRDDIIGKEYTLPSRRFPSDHLPIMGIFRVARKILNK